MSPTTLAGGLQRGRSRKLYPLGRGTVHTAHLVEAGGELPVAISFVDTAEHVNRVLPKLRKMAADRRIVRENVVIEQGRASRGMHHNGVHWCYANHKASPAECHSSRPDRS